MNHTIQQNVIKNNTNRKKHVGRLPLRHCYVASMGARWLSLSEYTKGLEQLHEESTKEIFGYITRNINIFYVHIRILDTFTAVVWKSENEGAIKISRSDVLYSILSPLGRQTRI